MPLCLGEAHEHYVAEQMTAPAIAFAAYRISWPGRLWDWAAEAYNEGYWSGIERIISTHTLDKSFVNYYQGKVVRKLLSLTSRSGCQKQKCRYKHPTV